jgi:hypothetical protein
LSGDCVTNSHPLTRLGDRVINSHPTTIVFEKTMSRNFKMVWVKLLLLVTASSCAAAFGCGGDAALGFKLASKKCMSLKSSATVRDIEKNGLKRLEVSMVATPKKSNPSNIFMQSTLPILLVCVGMVAVPNFCGAEPSTGNTGQVIFDTRCIKCHAGHRE